MIDTMNWTALTTEGQLEQLKRESATLPVLIFKHSTRCAISNAVLNRLERNWKQEEVKIKPYFLDLIVHRNISNQIAELFDVEHQSPQVMVVRDGHPVYVKSHYEINFEDLRESLAKN